MAGELRITGGALVRRHIKVPAAADKGLVRPTSDKVRAAVMSSIASSLVGARVLDLFAGSGALGFEALSRGASLCTFVEKDARTMRTVEDNAESLGVVDCAVCEVGEAARVLKTLEDRCIDVAFVDPPYEVDVERTLDLLVRVMAPGGIVVVERAKKSAPPSHPRLDVVRDRVYGDTRVLVLHVLDPESTERRPTMNAAIYPGSFDPLTNGHVDIVQRGLKTFDRVIVAVANNVQKSPLFTVPERIELAKECLGHLKNIEIDTFDGLIIEYAQKKGVHVLLRGLRAVSDFEYEFQLASMNRKLAKDVETVFMMTSEESFYLSSRLVREVASFGGNVEEMVPGPVLKALRARYPRKNKS